MAPIWVSSLARCLDEHELVKGVKVWPGKVIVRYVTGIMERYWFLDGEAPPRHRPIGRADAVPVEAAVTQIFEPDLSAGGESQYRYYGIGRKAWAAANAIGRALSLQRLVAMTVAAGYQRSSPPQALAADWEALRAADPEACDASGTIDFYPTMCSRPGGLLAAHYADLHLCRPRGKHGLAEAASRPGLISYLARRMARWVARPRSRKRITSYGLMRMLRCRFGPYMIFPSAYALLLSRLGARSLFDPHPETCAKALACAKLGIRYYTRPDPLFDAALARGLAGQIGLDHRYLGDGGTPDFALSDWNMTSFDYGEGLGYAGDAKRLLVGVPGHMKGDALAECAPEAIVDCRLSLGSRWHVFCW